METMFALFRFLLSALCRGPRELFAIQTISFAQVTFSIPTYYITVLYSPVDVPSKPIQTAVLVDSASESSLEQNGLLSASCLIEHN